ncbi:MAG: response regulator [Nitrospinae bacterium]|nr:response regulator [Nitrospinota bacterium]
MKKKIMMVDDSPMIRSVGGKILAKKGFEVSFAENGVDALEKLNGKPVDLIVLDYHMPRMNGFQTTLEIRSSAYKKEANVPILILSAEENPEDVSRLIEAGANDYICKKWLKTTPEIFLEKVFALLNFADEVEHYKERKLSRTISPHVLLFKKFVQKNFDKFTSGDDAVSVDEVREKIAVMNEKFLEGEFTEIHYDIAKPEDYLVVHTTNSTLLALMFGDFLNWDKEKIVNMALGAFFHDFGSLSSTKAFLTSPSSLNEEEFKLYLNHVEKGAEVAKNINLPQEAREYVENHHERMNGKGYPYHRGGEELSDIAQISAIIDSFDSLTSQKDVNKKLMVKEATRKMQSWGGQYSEEFLKQFDLFTRQFEFKRDT